jgi:hypothetical protein
MIDLGRKVIVAGMQGHSLAICRPAIITLRPYLDFINGAKMFGYLSNYGYMWGYIEYQPPYIGVPGGVTIRFRVDSTSLQRTVGTWHNRLMR